MAEATEPTLFERTQAELGFSDMQNAIVLTDPEADFPANGAREYKIFDTDNHGNLTILVYGIDKTVIKYSKKGDGKMSSINAKDKLYKILRLANPEPDKDGKINKYRSPKGQPTYPFFPPALCNKYEASEPINTLVITEGAKKAFKASLHGLDCVGISGIKNWVDKTTGELHGDIQLLITRCKVQNVVFLADGDCMNISSKDISEQTDLSKRPSDFYDAVNLFCRCVSDKKFDCKKYFAYIRTEDISHNPKGLDDLLVTHPGQETEIINDLLGEGIKADQVYTNQYFIKLDVTFNPLKVRKHMRLNSATDFYNYHVERRPELREKSFVFHGTTYRFDIEKGELKVETPGEAKDYIRVGIQYYRNVLRPSCNGEFMPVLEPWNRATIVEDHGKDFTRHVPKYPAFCVVPDHLNYQPVINNCYNLYFPLTHEPERGEYGDERDFPATMEFLKHIFGAENRQWNDTKTGETIDYREVDLGLDYVTIIYKVIYNGNPQILPILSLVSEERQTGKSTFLDWLKMILQANMVFVGNEDLENEFNKHWTTKRVIACEETKIERQKVLEKIKRLSTAKVATMNSKGKDQGEMDFFGVFILNSNNADNFVSIDEKEIRFWVREVKPLKNLNTEILNELRNEIPAFLYYLSNRQLKFPKRERHWFATELLKTDALTRIIKNTKPTIVKEIETYLADMFDVITEDTILMTKDVIRKVVFNNKGDLSYLERILENYLGLHKKEGKGGIYYKYPMLKTGEDSQEVSYIAHTGRPYTFTRQRFGRGPAPTTTDIHAEQAAQLFTDDEKTPF